MKDKILNKWEELWNDLHDNYNKIIVKDDYDNTKYTILYLNKNESFEKVEDLWKELREEFRENDESYDYIDTLSIFLDRIDDKIDIFEFSMVDIYTEHEYELEI
jgi:hypothetical protein